MQNTDSAPIVLVLEPSADSEVRSPPSRFLASTHSYHITTDRPSEHCAQSVGSAESIEAVIIDGMYYVLSPSQGAPE